HARDEKRDLKPSPRGSGRQRLQLAEIGPGSGNEEDVAGHMTFRLQLRLARASRWSRPRTSRSLPIATGGRRGYCIKRLHEGWTPMLSLPRKAIAVLRRKLRPVQTVIIYSPTELAELAFWAERRPLRIFLAPALLRMQGGFV